LGEKEELMAGLGDDLNKSKFDKDSLRDLLKKMKDLEDDLRKKD
jgi:flagellar basal body P-ring protein FlgI